jgi:uncharacterized coiled-coil DUF342 family protein
MKFPTPDKMRERFHELRRHREAILAKSAPLREKRDAIVNEARERETKLNDQIVKAEATLFEIDQEAAMIARALGGQTGAPPEPAKSGG